jgi:hypothetical protein
VTLLTLLSATFGSLQSIAAYSYGFLTQHFCPVLLNDMLQDGVEGWSAALAALSIRAMAVATRLADLPINEPTV